jgi:TolB-like protein/tetratricopeptide (TPR) repeat protein
MTTSATSAPLSKDAEKKIRRQLERVLASRVFQQVDRLKRFLSFIVVETLAGRRGELKEYVVGVQVFGKEESFDPRTDPVVRVQARRLRARLTQYYQEEGQADEVVIDLPKGGYTPIFTRRDSVTHQRRSIGAALLSRNTVAVLPLADHSATQDLDYFCRGVREEVIHRLTSLGGLRVLAWDPAAAAAGDPRESVNKANVATVISGSVRTLGDKVRVTTQIVDGATGCYLWSESTDSHLADAFGTQERVAQTLVRQIEQELIGGGSAGPTRRTTPNLAAQNLLLQGRYHLGQRTVESLYKAIEFFERALVEDAQYAPAHSGLSDAYSLLAHYGGIAPAEVWTKAASSAATAVMLDNNSAEAHTSLAHAKATQDWDWHGAEREFLAAIALDPRYATARHWYTTSCLTPLGRLDEALEQVLMASALDPVSVIIAKDVATTYYYRKELDLALEQCDHTIELNPHFSPAYWTLGLIQEQRGELDESVAAFQRAANLSPRSPRMQAALARAYALAGKRQAATKILHDLETLSSDRHVSPFEFALIHFALGQAAVGFRWLSKACKDRCFELISIKVDPLFDALRDDPRLTAIAAQVGVS